MAGCSPTPKPPVSESGRRRKTPGTAFALTYARFRGELRSRTGQTIARQALRSPGRSGWGAGDAGAGFRYLRFAQKSDPASECLREKGSTELAAEAATPVTDTQQRTSSDKEVRKGEPAVQRSRSFVREPWFDSTVIRATDTGMHSVRGANPA